MNTPNPKFKDLASFLTELEKNNNKVWMDANRNKYLNAKEIFYNLVANIHEHLSKELKSVTLLDPKKSIYRINRDIRFSHDKTPYKTWLAASICPLGDKSHGSSFYFHLTSSELVIGTGVWEPEKSRLENLRHYIVDQNIEYNKLLKKLSKSNISMSYNEGKLKKIPRGFNYVEDLALAGMVSQDTIESIKNKSYIVTNKIEIDIETPITVIVEIISSFFITSIPFYNFIDIGQRYDDRIKY